MDLSELEVRFLHLRRCVAKMNGGNLPDIKIDPTVEQIEEIADIVSSCGEVIVAQVAEVTVAEPSATVQVDESVEVAPAVASEPPATPETDPAPAGAPVVPETPEPSQAPVAPESPWTPPE